MNKKSAGVTVFAVLFVIFGLGGILSSTYSLLIHNNERDLNAVFWEKTETFPADIKYMVSQSPYVDNILNAFEEIIGSAEYKIVTAINGIMSLIFVIIGFDIFKRKARGRRLAIIVFCLSVPIYFLAGNLFLSRIREAFEGNNLSALLYVFGRFPLVTFYSSLNLIMLLINAVVVVLFFCRRDVVAQFE